MAKLFETETESAGLDIMERRRAARTHEDPARHRRATDGGGEIYSGIVDQAARRATDGAVRYTRVSSTGGQEGR